MIDWAGRAARLADEMERDGELRSPQWRAVLHAVPRHVLVPHFYRPDSAGGWLLVDGGDPALREQWLSAVYSDTTLVTALVDAPLPAEWGGGAQRVAVSSSTMPSLVIRMLEDLDVRDGDAVLEIGTGSGYNAALLSARLGDSRVASVDLRPDLVAAAADRLAAIGYHPRLAARDGAHGFGEHAPYDRIIATCATRYVPPAWISQLRPGGMMLIDIEGPVGAGNLAALWRRGAKPVVAGRFLSRRATFMWMAHQLGLDAGPRPTAGSAANREAGPGGATERVTGTGPAVLHERHLVAAFLAQLNLPPGTALEQSGEGDGTRTRLIAPDGSVAQVTDRPDADGRHRVTETGPTPLWRRVEDAAATWRDLGSPPWERFGITAATDRQCVWFDHPGGPRTWPLDLAGSP